MWEEGKVRWLFWLCILVVIWCAYSSYNRLTPQEEREGAWNKSYTNCREIINDMGSDLWDLYPGKCEDEDDHCQCRLYADEHWYEHYDAE